MGKRRESARRAPSVLSWTPAVLGRPLDYQPAFYIHAAVLHASVVLRVVGDLSEGLARLRPWGGLFNAVALLLFLGNAVRAGVRSRFSK